MVYQPVEAQLNNPKMNSRLFSTLLRIVRQRVFEHSRMIKSYRVLRRLRKRVFLLGKHGTLIFKKSMPFRSTNMQARKIFFFFVRISLVLCVLAICCCLSLIMGCVDLFHAMLDKIGFSLGARALSVFLIKMGCSGGLALAIAVLFKAFFTAEAAPDLGSQMASSGAENSVSTFLLYLRDLSSNTEGESAHEPSTSSSWTGALISSETETGGTGTSVNQGVARPVPPANPVASGEAEAGPSHVVPFPYDGDEVIGGDSVESIQRRLLSKQENPSPEIINLARLDAEDRFEVKVEIIKGMTALDPEGDWPGRGARALDNPYTATGEESLETLSLLRDRVAEGDAATISTLKQRMLWRRSDGDTESQA